MMRRQSSSLSEEQLAKMEQPKRGAAEWKPVLRHPTATPVEAGPGGVRRKGGFHHPGRLAIAVKRRADEEAVMAQFRPWASSPSHDANALGFRDEQGNEIVAQAPYDVHAMRQDVAASKARHMKPKHAPQPPQQRGKANQRGNFPIHRPQQGRNQRSGSKRTGV